MDNSEEQGDAEAAYVAGAEWTLWLEGNLLGRERPRCHGLGKPESRTT
jgi:hypothetical protein